MTGGILLCMLGSVLQETLYWLQLRARGPREEFIKMFYSVWTWVFAAFIILIITPVLSYVWFASSAAVLPKDYLLFGAGVPMIVKSGMGVSLASESVVKLGPTNWLRRYLGVC